MNRIDRLFGILLRLQRAGRIRAQDLARHFEVSERTIYCDIAALNELGVPIISLPNVGYELPAGFSLPPIFFTPGEAGALALAVQLLLAQTMGTTSHDAERALTKIAAILPRELRGRVDELSAVVRFYAADRPFDLDGLQRTLAEVTATQGAPSVLLYNAVAFTPGPISTISADALLDGVRTSAAGALVATQAVLPAMRERGQGSLLFTGGGAALYAIPNLATLSIGKAALRLLALGLAQELADSGINVGTVTIAGTVAPSTPFDPERIAELFWGLHSRPAGAGEVEIVVRGATS
jgi:NAD(P)-dependent dehydrogenase (short-subunit alcohol dehydrogenase family)/biotin operon repressor